MSEDKDRPGLGKIIYSVDDPKETTRPTEEKVDDADIKEAAEESFPASDPPGFAGGSGTESN